ncbi:DUF7824 domain-containing protein [Nonomuraea candida]|uniref:DUF7824 domain-containing protein n=1 Tax=Nonomuraea candida TaxID=359159 RepID=UPI0005B76D7C|nr:DUF6493 family protein [Nonomuraea candida]
MTPGSVQDSGETGQPGPPGDPGAGGSAWAAVVAAIDAGDPDEVAARVLGLDERGRREVAAALPAHLPVAEKRAQARRMARVTRRERQNEAAWQEHLRAAARAGRTVYDHERLRWDAPWNRPVLPGRDERWAGAMRVAGAAAFAGPAAVAAWLNRRDLQERPNDGSWAVLERVLALRPAAWQADFAVRAARRLRPVTRGRGGHDPMAALVLSLLRRSGAVPPGHDPLVVAWAARPPLAAGLAGDPLLDHLLPRLFEAEGVGRALRDERADPPAPTGWLGALLALERDGRIGRDLLLDGCLRRFLRGGEVADLRFFVRLHELLGPTPDEVSRRRHDYLRLLPAAPGTVAEQALRHLRRLPDLDPEDVTEALLALLSRGERKLLTAGLTWLDEVAADPSTDLAALAPALGYAFACESADVQGRAVRLVVKHAKRFGAEGARAVRDAIAVLPGDLGETLAAVFGGEAWQDPREADGFTPVPLPAPLAAAPFPPPVTAAGELEVRPKEGRWEAGELWLAGVVRLCSADPAALAARLAAARPAESRPEEEAGHRLEVSGWAEEIARLVVREAGPGRPAATPSEAVRGEEALGAGTGPGTGTGTGTGVEARRGKGARVPGAGEAPGPHRFLLWRWAEVYEAIEAGTAPPYLLAEPTAMTGHLDPGELVERLAGYERAGAAPLPADLQQALLRLPREIPPDVVARAARLTSGAGRAAARWMGGDRPEPLTRITWWYYPPAGTPGHGDRRPYDNDHDTAGPGSGLSELASQLHLTPLPEPSRADRGFPRDGAGAGDVGGGPAWVRELLGGEVGHGLKEHDGLMSWWPYLMPSDREAVAAHLVPHLTERWQRARAEPAQAWALALADGPAGEAVALVQAYFAADRARSADPRARARPLVELAARGDLDAEQVGRQLALLVRRTELKPGPVFETLERAAALGAQREVWRIMTGFLAVFLPGPGERSHTRHTQGLVFAARAARWARARGAVPCVAEIAARRASNNFVREARRLHTYLT